MTISKIRCLILSCGNTLRSDDGIGPFLSEWAREHYAADTRIAVLTRHQWTPDLALDLAEAETALFIDCAVNLEPGAIQLQEIESAAAEKAMNTHHTGAPELLGLTQAFYSAAPRRALLLTIGAGSIELGESFSAALQAAVPEAQRHLVEAVESLLQNENY